MAPVLVESVARSSAKDFKKESASARLLGSGKRADSYFLATTDH